MARLLVSPQRRLIVSPDGRRLLTDDPGCLTACCGQDAPLWQRYCPCNQGGCHPQHPVVWIRVDVQCDCSNGHTGSPQCLAVNRTTLRIVDWCYSKAAEPAMPEQFIPRGELKIPGDIAPSAIWCPSIINGCGDPQCIPPGSGDCPCGCQGLCYTIAPNPSECICCCGGVDQFGNSSFSYEYIRTDKQWEEWIPIAAVSDPCFPEAPSVCLVYSLIETAGGPTIHAGCTARRLHTLSVDQRQGPEPFICQRPMVNHTSQFEREYSCMPTAQPNDTGIVYSYRNPNQTCPDRDEYARHRSIVSSNCIRLSISFWEEIVGWGIRPVGPGGEGVCACMHRTTRLVSETWTLIRNDADQEGCCGGCRQEVCGNNQTGGGCPPLNPEPLQEPVSEPSGATSPTFGALRATARTQTASLLEML